MIENNICSMLTIAIMNLPTGLFIVDTKGIVQFINYTYASYLMIKPEDVIGHHITELIPDSRIINTLKTGKQDIGAFRQFQSSGKHFITNRYPLYNANGDLIGAMSMVVLDKLDQLSSLQKQIDKLSRRVNRYAQRIKAALEGRYTIDSIISRSDVMHAFKQSLLRFAKTDVPILINGPTGSGKELAASAVHNASMRRDGPFVSLNCAAIPQELFESELFGYAPGAFSGASKDGKEGQIELADQGTLFLDEVGDLPLGAQVKLLRVIEERTVRRIGSSTPHSIDFRLLTATNRDLEKMVASGTFRADLYYRINSMVLTIPPLKDRLEDIPLLVEHFLERSDNVHCSEEVMAIFQKYSWPGNVRELRNVVSYALSLVDGNIIEVKDIPSSLSMGALLRDEENTHTSKLDTLRDNSERSVILQELKENAWNVTRTARILGISRANMYEKMNRLGIKRNQKK